MYRVDLRWLLNCMQCFGMKSFTTISSVLRINPETMNVQHVTSIFACLPAKCIGTNFVALNSYLPVSFCVHKFVIHRFYWLSIWIYLPACCLRLLEDMHLRFWCLTRARTFVQKRHNPAHELWYSIAFLPRYINSPDSYASSVKCLVVHCFCTVQASMNVKHKFPINWVCVHIISSIDKVTHWLEMISLWYEPVIGRKAINWRASDKAIESENLSR